MSVADVAAGSGLPGTQPQGALWRLAARVCPVTNLIVNRDSERLVKWNAVVGRSYGTVLAQQYTAKYPQFVDKLVLVGAISLHEFLGIDDVLFALVQGETLNLLLSYALIPPNQSPRLFGRRSAP